MKINTLLKELQESLENEFEDNFTGLVLFGSYAKGTQKPASDVDLIVTFKKLPNTRHERIELIEEILNNLEIKYKFAINPIIKKENELKLDFLMADIGEYAKIIVDKNYSILKLFTKIKNQYKKNLIKKISSGNHYRLYVENV